MKGVHSHIRGHQHQSTNDTKRRPAREVLPTMEEVRCTDTGFGDGHHRSNAVTQRAGSPVNGDSDGIAGASNGDVPTIRALPRFPHSSRSDEDRSFSRPPPSPIGSGTDDGNPVRGCWCHVSAGRRRYSVHSTSSTDLSPARRPDMIRRYVAPASSPKESVSSQRKPRAP